MFRIVNHPECHFYQRGQMLLEQQPILFGISPGNSFFSESSIKSLLEYLCDISPYVYILIPDKPHKYNFLGLGYSEKDAVKKSRKETNITQNRVTRACNAFLATSSRKNFRILNWTEEIESSSHYSDWQHKVNKLFNSNLQFHEQISILVENYLISRAQSRSTTEINIHQASNYFLCELAAFSALNHILGTPVTIAYHKYFNIGLDFLETEFAELDNQFSLLHYQLQETIEYSS